MLLNSTTLIFKFFSILLFYSEITHIFGQLLAFHPL